MREDFKELLATLESYGIGLKQISADFYEEPQRRGTYHFVHSPATHDATPSLCLYQNRFVDYANGNKSGDIIGFVSYTKGINNWDALQMIKSFYGIQGDRERTREEILRQQAERECKEKRKQAFYKALNDEISRLKQWLDILAIATENQLFKPFSDMWEFCINQCQITEYQLDILCASDMDSYRRMKYSDNLSSDRPQWLLDVLAILTESGTFIATRDEINKFKKAVVDGGRCELDW